MDAYFLTPGNEMFVAELLADGEEAGAGEDCRFRSGHTLALDGQAVHSEARCFTSRLHRDFTVLGRLHDGSRLRAPDIRRW